MVWNTWRVRHCDPAEMLYQRLLNGKIYMGLSTSTVRSLFRADVHHQLTGRCVDPAECVPHGEWVSVTLLKRNLTYIVLRVPSHIAAGY